MLAFEPASRPGTGELAARLQRCSPESRSVRRTRAALAVAIAIVFGISTLFLAYRSRVENAVLNAALDKSIAVLPFENLSPDPNNVYFADGVQDEILTRLASLADLKVINRTSVMQYKSGAARDLHKIGHQLGVARVVEGSVQRAGNRVRVNAQLIDVSTNRALWGQSYDRDLADVFAIQSEIAISIAQHLQASLSVREKTAIEQAPTNDVTAFDLYSHAENLLLITFSSVARAKLLEAVDLLNQAVARDPSFFQAYCGLVDAHDRLYRLGLDRTPARLALAEEAVQAASRLRPNAGEAHLARAGHLYNAYLDYDGALAELEVASRSLPNNSRIFAMMGLIQRRQGRWEESTRNLERAIELDPRATFPRFSSSRSATECSTVILRKHPSWSARWPWSRTMSIRKSRLQPSNFIGKPIPNHCTRLSIPSGPQIPARCRMWPVTGLAARWPSTTSQWQRTHWMRSVTHLSTTTLFT